VLDLGTQTYGDVLQRQRDLACARRDGTLRHDVLLLVEHPHVLTLGRGADRSHVLASEAQLEARGVEVIEVERGGDVTYHGPGQIVGYPILDLHGYRKDLHWYLRRLEEVCLRTSRAYGLAGARVKGYTGVWTSGAVSSGTVSSGAAAPGALPSTVEDDAFPTLSEARAATLVPRGDVRKIASIGVHASRWVTWHGFAFNVTEEPLEAFDWIVPCGIPGVRMTSLHAEGVRVPLDDVRATIIEAFGETFDVPVIEIELAAIARAAEPTTP